MSLNVWKGCNVGEILVLRKCVLSVYKTDKGLHNKLMAAWQLDSSQMLLAFAETTKWKRRTMP